MPTTTHVRFEVFLNTLTQRLHSIFHDRLEEHGEAHGPAVELEPIIEMLRTPTDTAPLSVFIPERFGGRGQHVHECLAMLAACSYESLPLSLVAGINGALFLQPLSKYARDELQAEVFSRFLNDGALGGLMITEPEYGSDALRMRTEFRPEDDGFRVRGTKHWGGLTGRADYWLLTAREATEDDGLGRNINFFVWDRSLGGIEVEEYYQSLGLEMIPYGRNRIDTHVPAARRMEPLKSGVRMLLDVLHRSRLQFPGMAMGFLHRILDDALAHVRARVVGGKPLADYDQVQGRLAEIQAAYTTCSAMCAYTSDVAAIDHDCSNDAPAANSIKSVVTDMMQSAAQSLLQLVGAKGYRRTHLAGSAVVDSRPFQIFEGSNDILYEQLSDVVVKSMRKAKEMNLARFAGAFQPAARAAQRLKSLLDFSVPETLPQRKKVDFGRIMGRLITLDMVFALGERGFRADLIENCCAVTRREIASLIGSFANADGPDVIEDYRDGGSWLDYVAGS